VLIGVVAGVLLVVVVALGVALFGPRTWRKALGGER
jgi:cytochrome c oxidase subunit 2